MSRKPFRTGFLILVCCYLLGSLGCQGVSLNNRTNQQNDYEAYLPTLDVFKTGKPYTFKLKVNRESNFVPINSIRPSIFVNGTRHDMTILGSWSGNSSVWVYEPTEKCPDVGFASNWGFKYSYSVGYDRSSLGVLFVASPPARIPNTGDFHARVFDAGNFHFDPVGGVVYDQGCWDTNLGCVPDLNAQTVVSGTWPGPASGYEYTLVLRNLTQQNVRLMMIQVVSYQGNPPNPDYEVVASALPQTVNCEGTYTFKLRYKPGYYNQAGFTSGTYNESGMIQTKILGPNNQLIDGPRIYVNWKVFVNPP